ncbi:hypothetical protein SAMN04488005_0662 [Yoonia tamlensis]|uniref:Uncharacterized protein n=1 Tax=Yoonia tamlensis TaxID=390270 RepID=A0A1I6FWY7_9RHOB|nr:hypothetical protein [Yoonia tamlensis]SFR34495.1 hypothetical protein SAMN04488005_0662 [Yoonia tamlensis]
MRKTRENIFLGVVAVLMFCGLGAWLNYEPKPNQMFETGQDTFLVRADGNVFVGGDLEIVPVLDSHYVSAVLALAQDRGGWTRLSAERLRSLCGGLIMRAMREGDVTRKQIYRVEIGMMVTLPNEAEPQEVSYPVSVRDGACISEHERDMQALSLPAPMDQWTLVGLDVDQDGEKIEATFRPYRGLDYDTAYAQFDPKTACNALMLDPNETVSGPVTENPVTQISVVAQNWRGNSIAGFGTSQAWEVPVAGGVCLDNFDGVPS